MLQPKVVVSCSLAALLGLFSVVLPVFVLPPPRSYQAPLFPWVRTGIEGMSFLTLLLLFASGLFLGFACSGHPWLLGVCAMAAFPLLAVAEMVVDPSSHNLFPIEFVVYGVVSLVAVLGAFVGRSVRRQFSRKQE